MKLFTFLRDCVLCCLIGVVYEATRGADLQNKQTVSMRIWQVLSVEELD